MLSIEQCRKLIPEDEKYTDKQIEEMKASLYEVAKLALGEYTKQQSKRNSE